MRLDLRSEQPNPPLLTKQKHALVGRGAKARVVSRDPRTVDGIVLHQTACVFGKKKTQPTRHHRALGVACHALAFNDGTAVLANPLPWLVWHGNGYNDRSLGLEVEGNFPGLIGDPRTLAMSDKPETPVTPLLISTACDALKWLVEEGRALGMPLRYLWAHRQSSGTRRSDPGEGLWRPISAFAVAELGLVLELGASIDSKNSGHGRPIPAAWGGAGPY